MKFSELGLIEPILRATRKLDYKIATPIQAQAIPVVLAGRDLIACAQTGTGKTAAFTLPMLNRISQAVLPGRTNRTIKGCRHGASAELQPRVLRALVLAPTRELAAQIGESLDRYGKFTSIKKTVVYGGVSQHRQVKALRRGVDALVATPGRLLDLMEQGYIDLSRIEILVLDEADQMLDMGFQPALKRIVGSAPKQRQTLMFTATMPRAIRRLAQRWLKSPDSIEIVPCTSATERITQTVHLVDKKLKPALLAHLLKQTSRGRTLVFSRTKYGADKIVKRLKKSGVHSAAIHGNKSQGARSRTLAQFKGNDPPVLVATDIAARGLHIDNVSHVVNFDLPEVPETYVHRIGRTARAGATGVAVSFCSGDEQILLEQIEKLIQQTIAIEPAIDGFAIADTTSHSKRVSNGRRRRGRPVNRHATLHTASK